MDADAAGFGRARNDLFRISPLVVFQAHAGEVAVAQMVQHVDRQLRRPQVDPGFRGVDTLAYEAFYRNGRSGSTTVTINVK